MRLYFFMDFLFRCALINYAVLILWAMIFKFAHENFYAFSNRLCYLPAARFDALNYAGITFYKIGNLLLFVVPYIALRVAV